MDRSPEEQMRATLLQPKRDAVGRLGNDVATVEWQVKQRRAELDARRTEIRRRCEHVKATQLLYEAALAQCSGAGLDALVDRMVHQTPKAREQ